MKCQRKDNVTMETKDTPDDGDCVTESSTLMSLAPRADDELRTECLVTGDVQGEGSAADGEEEDGHQIVKEGEDANPAPDGGWGWMIVLGSVLVHFLIGGVERSAGIIFLKFDDKFHQSAAATAWSTSLPAGLRLTLGPLCSILCNVTSHRSVVFVGGILMCISEILTAFSTSLSFTYFSYGIIGGLGRCFSYAPAVVIVAQYFSTRRGLAVGLATSGVGFGSFVFPTLIELLFDFYGFFGAFLILAALVLNISACGCLFRPLWIHVKMMASDERRKRDAELVTDPVLCEKTDNGYTGPDTKNHGNTGPETNCGTQSNQQGSKTDEPPTAWLSKLTSTFSSSASKSHKPKTKLFELSLFRDIRFSSFCGAILMFTISFQSAYVFIPAYARSKGMSDLEASYTLAVAGFFDGVSRILFGFILDLKRVKPYRIYVYNAVLFLLGIVSFFVPHLDTLAGLCGLCAVFGLLVGIYISQKSVILVDILGVDRLVNSFGLLITFQGLGMFIGPPISGLLKDLNGDFDDGFYFGGVSMICGALILLTANIIHHVKLRRTN